MGWIGSPEEQRKFDEEVDKKIRIDSNQKKFGKYFICKYCTGIITYTDRTWRDGKSVLVENTIQCRDYWNEDATSPDDYTQTEDSKGCDKFDNGGAFESEAEADITNKSW